MAKKTGLVPYEEKAQEVEWREVDKKEQKREAKESKARQKAEKQEVKRQEKILAHDRKTALYKAETKEYRARISHRRARSRAMSKTGVGHLFSNIKRDTRRGKHGLRIF